MTQPDLFALAQQGNPDAIARWLNHLLQPRGVLVRVLIQANLLKILLIADRPLNQQAFVSLLQRHLSEFNLSDNLFNLDRVKVYCQHSDSKRPVWTAEFPLIPKTSSSDSRPDSRLGAIASIAANLPADSANLSAENRVQLSRSFRKELPFALFPVREVFRREIYQRPIVLLLLFLALVPLLVNLLSEQLSLAQTAWLTGTYYAVLCSFLLYYLIKPTSVSWGMAIGCALLTVIFSIPVLLMLQQLPPFRFLYEATGQGLVGRLLGFVLGVGVLEEACKAVPLLLILRFRKVTDLKTIAFYGAMSGLGFAVSESGAYAVQYAIAIARGRLDLGLYLTANTIRFVSLPLFHAVLSGILGYFIGLAMRFPRRRFDLLIWGLAIVALLHGLYNAFSGGLPGTVIIGFSLLLFVIYLDRTPKTLQLLEASSTNAQHPSRQSETCRKN